MKFWQVATFAETEQLPEIAHDAEEAGFHGILVSDHLFYPEKLDSRYPYSPDGRPAFGPTSPFPDPLACIAAMASVTRRLRFATMVYILPLRNPIEVAKTTGTVAVLSGGRLDFGCGAGWIEEEYRALGVDFRTRGRRFDECIAVLRKLWRGEMTQHHGEFFDFGRIQMSPMPRDAVPILIGGTTAPALRRAARLGDGWIGTGHPPEDAAALLGRLHALRREAGREALPFETIVPLAAAPDPALLRRMEQEHGMTSAVAAPFAYTVGPASPVARKRDAMRRFADEVIAKLA